MAGGFKLDDNPDFVVPNYKVPEINEEKVDQDDSEDSDAGFVH